MSSRASSVPAKKANRASACPPPQTVMPALIAADVDPLGLTPGAYAAQRRRAS